MPGSACHRARCRSIAWVRSIIEESLSHWPCASAPRRRGQGRDAMARRTCPSKHRLAQGRMIGSERFARCTTSKRIAVVEDPGPPVQCRERDGKQPRGRPSGRPPCHPARPVQPLAIEARRKGTVHPFLSCSIACSPAFTVPARFRGQRHRQPEMDTLSVVIVNWNAGRALDDCLDALFASESIGRWKSYWWTTPPPMGARCAPSRRIQVSSSCRTRRTVGSPVPPTKGWSGRGRPDAAPEPRHGAESQHASTAGRLHEPAARRGGRGTQAAEP